MNHKKTRILLLDAYDAPSHQYWRKGLVEYLPVHDWTVLTLPPRFFRWRIRGNGLTWGKGDFDELDQAYDLIIATSMVDLTTLRGFKPRLGLIPTLVYFHENQFEYPEQFTGSDKKVESIDPQIVNLYSALAADHIAFNSDFNRTSFVDGAKKLLKKLPDAVPKGLVDELKQKSTILPVPMQDDLFIERKPLWNAKPIHLLWNHRWEYDKAPDRLALMVKELLKTELDFRLHIVGQSFRSVPKELLDLKSHSDEASPDLIETFGFVESKQDYLALLQRCDFVLSTALHDFQGLSVIEAVASGCIPIVPNRLAYTEWFDEPYRYESYIDNPEAEAKAMADKISNIAGNFDQAESSVSVANLSWSHLLPQYRLLVEQLCAQH